MNNKNALEICEKIKFILFPYFSGDFEKIFVNLSLTDDGYSSRAYKVLLKNGKIKCISNYHSIPGNKSDYLLDLFKELKEQMKDEYGAWQNCFFYITKDNKYEVDFVFNPNGNGNDGSVDNIGDFSSLKGITDILNSKIFN